MSIRVAVSCASTAASNAGLSANALASTTAVAMPAALAWARPAARGLFDSTSAISAG